MKRRGFDSVTSWIISLYCCLIFTLLLIPYRLLGLMFVSIVEYYETDRETASIPIFLYMVIRCFLGPFVGMLGLKVGIENLTLIGCFVISVGIGGCYFARDIIGIGFFLGLVHGIGLACGNAFLPSIIKKHFLTHGATANGVYLSGSSVGAIVIPPATFYLLDRYDVPGTFLIMGAVMLNSAPAAMIVRNLSKRQKTWLEWRRSRSKGYSHETSKLIPCSEMEVKEKCQLKTDNSNEKDDCSIVSQIQTVERNEVDSLHQNIRFTFSDSDGMHDKDLVYDGEDKIVSVDVVQRNASKLSYFKEISAEDSVKQSSRTSDTSFSSKKEHSITEKIPLPQKSKATPSKKSISLRAFTEPTFLFIMINCGLIAYNAVLAWTTLIDYSRDKGIARELEKYFLMVQPFCEITGRLGLGWVYDRKFVSDSLYSFICYSALGLLTGCIIWSQTFELLLTAVMLFGLVSGAISPFFATLVYKYVTEENQTVAQASLYSVFGILIFTSSPLIGYFRETRGSYDGLYYLVMGIYLLCSLLFPLMFRFSKEIVRKDAMVEERKETS